MVKMDPLQGSLHHNRANHAWVDTAAVMIGAWLRECIVPHVKLAQGRRLNTSINKNRVCRTVLICPTHRISTINYQFIGIESEVPDVNSNSFGKDWLRRLWALDRRLLRCALHWSGRNRHLGRTCRKKHCRTDDQQDTRQPNV